MSNTQAVATLLEKAILAGDEAKAAIYAQALAREQARVQIKVLPSPRDEFLTQLTEWGIYARAGHDACMQAWTKFGNSSEAVLLALQWLDLEPAQRQEQERREEEKQKREEETENLIRTMQEQEAREKKEREEADAKMVKELLKEEQERKEDEKRRAEEASSQLLASIKAEEEKERVKRQKLNEENLSKNIDVIMALEKTVAKDAKVEPNLEPFDCPICMSTIEIGEGLVLRSCQHSLCKDCIKYNVESNIKNGEYPVKCPNLDCRKPLAQMDLRVIVGEEVFSKLEERMIGNFEAENKNTFHCKTADCKGWCEFEEKALIFTCPLCKKDNCIPCGASHPKMNCKQYQEDLKLKATNDEDAKKTQAFLEEMIKQKQAARCPGCQILVMKISGCDWMQCRMCKCEICWATMGPRWGPKGKGDTSGGCKCVYPAKKCTPTCGNCH